MGLHACNTRCEAQGRFAARSCKASLQAPLPLAHLHEHMDLVTRYFLLDLRADVARGSRRLELGLEVVMGISIGCSVPQACLQPACSCLSPCKLAANRRSVVGFSVSISIVFLFQVHVPYDWCQHTHAHSASTAQHQAWLAKGSRRTRGTALPRGRRARLPAASRSSDIVLRGGCGR